MRVGVIGLGVMGSRMAKNLIRSGHNIVVYNRSPGPITGIVSQGAEAASSPENLGARCHLVILALLDSKAVEMTVLGENGLIRGMLPGGIVVDTSTIEPEIARKIAMELQKKGIHYLDAPVSGGPEGAASGTLSIMVGGDTDTFERSRPILSEIGKNIFHVGGTGSGLEVKLFNQALVGVYFAGIAEAYIWAKKSGLRIEDLQKIITVSWGDSPVFRHVVSTLISGEVKGGASIRNLKKDLDIILRSAEFDEVHLSVIELAEKYLTRAIELGYEDYDASILYSILEKIDV